MPVVAVERLTGNAIEPALEALATLRISVFREFPYLYEGSLDYERKYLREFAASPRSTLIVARDGARIVGASTATPLLEHGEGQACAKALRDVGIDATQVFYFGESVLLPAYRGHGVGHAFFDHREACARELGYRIASFCAVERPRDHPARPADYVSHDAFWTRRGFHKQPGAVAQFKWCDLGDSALTFKPMVFWTKELSA